MKPSSTGAPRPPPSPLSQSVPYPPTPTGTAATGSTAAVKSSPGPAARPPSLHIPSAAAQARVRHRDEAIRSLRQSLHIGLATSSASIAQEPVAPNHRRANSSSPPDGFASAHRRPTSAIAVSTLPLPPSPVNAPRSAPTSPGLRPAAYRTHTRSFSTERGFVWPSPGSTSARTTATFIEVDDDDQADGEREERGSSVGTSNSSQPSPLPSPVHAPAVHVVHVNVDTESDSEWALDSTPSTATSLTFGTDDSLHQRPPDGALLPTANQPAGRRQRGGRIGAGGNGNGSAGRARRGEPNLLAQFDVKRHFLVTLAEALIKFGSPAYRMEYLLIMASRTLKVSISVTMLPNLLLMTYENQDTHINETIILTVKQGYDLDKLFQTNTLCKALAAKQLAIEQAVDDLEDLIDTPASWSGPVYCLACAGCSAFVAPLAFNGSFADAALSGILGFFVGVLDLASGKFDAISYIYEIGTATLVALLAAVAKLALEAPRASLAIADLSNVGSPDPTRLCYTGVTLSTLFVILPGLSIATSFIELNSLNVISGTVRLAVGLVKTLSIAFGILLGSRVALNAADAWWPKAVAEQFRSDLFSSCSTSTALASMEYRLWVFIPLLVLFSLCQGVQLRASPKQFGIITVAVFIAFWTSEALSQLKVGIEVTAAASAFAVGIAGNLYSRFSSNPGIAPIVSGILILVPGGLGVRSSISLIATGPTIVAGASGSLIIQMLLIALCIALGVLCSRIVPPVETQLETSRIVQLRRKLALAAAKNTSDSEPWLSRVWHQKVHRKPSVHHHQQAPPLLAGVANQNEDRIAVAVGEGTPSEREAVRYQQKLRMWVRRWDWQVKSGKAGRAEKAKVKKWARRLDSVSGSDLLQPAVATRPIPTMP